MLDEADIATKPAPKDASTLRELTAEDVRAAWLEIGAGPGATASGWYSLLAKRLNARLVALCRQETK